MTSIPSDAGLLPVTVPELDDRSQPLLLVQWLVDPVAQLRAGDRIAELLIAGVVFHLASPMDGVLQRTTASAHSRVQIGQVVALVLPASCGD